MSEQAMAAKGARLLSFLWETWCQGGTLDGGDIQDFMVKERLAKVVPYDPAVHGTDFEASEFMEPGDDYYVATDLGKAMLDSVRLRAVGT